MRVNLRVNGEDRTVDVSPRATLVELLREELGLTGTKVGCGRGECGACTVLFDGAPVNACLVFAAQCEGREVTTIEGVSADGDLSPLQQAFVEAGAVQCGYCTPGMIMSGSALLNANSSPGRGEIEEALSGNLCRCTGYVKVVDAVERASRVRGSADSADDDLEREC